MERHSDRIFPNGRGVTPTRPLFASAPPSNNRQRAGAVWWRGRAGARAAPVDRREIAAIFAGGALGALLRAALAQAFPHPATAWPWPTFGVNIVAAFLLGYFVTRLTERLPLSLAAGPLLISAQLAGCWLASRTSSYGHSGDAALPVREVQMRSRVALREFTADRPVTVRDAAPRRDARVVLFLA